MGWSRIGFARTELDPVPARGGVLPDDDDFRVRAVHLDHAIPCVGFALEEKAHLNVSKSRLDELGLPTDPSLNERQRLARAAAVKRWLPVHFSSRHTAKRTDCRRRYRTSLQTPWVRQWRRLG